MLRILVRLSVILSSACLLAGCATFGLHQTARTTPPGKFEYGGIVTPVLIPIIPQSDAYASWPVGYFPIPELYARMGLSDNSDLGFRWSFGPGMGVDYKFRMASGGVDVAGMLGGSFYGLFMSGSGVGVYSFYPRLILSREGKPGTPWAFNAGFDYLGGFTTDTYGGGSGLGILSLRAGFGLPFRAFESVRIMPELSVNFPVTAGSDGTGIDIPQGNGLLTLGVSVGSIPANKTPAPTSP